MPAGVLRTKAIIKVIFFQGESASVLLLDLRYLFNTFLDTTPLHIFEITQLFRSGEYLVALKISL